MTKTVIEFGNYTSRVLDVIKAKFGLKTKGQALDKFAEMYGEEFVDLEVKEEYVKKILAIENDYFLFQNCSYIRTLRR